MKILKFLILLPFALLATLISIAIIVMVIAVMTEAAEAGEGKAKPGFELWGCSEISTSRHPHQVELDAYVEGGLGSIDMQGLPTITTWFKIQGFKRSWIWDDEGPAEEYSFTILGNTGRYYEFFKTGKPTRESLRYNCHRH